MESLLWESPKELKTKQGGLFQVHGRVFSYPVMEYSLSRAKESKNMQVSRT